MSSVNRKNNFWRSRLEEGKAQMRYGASSAVAEREKARVAPFVVASGPGYEVKLVYIPLGTSPEYRTESAADILCLDLDEFGLSEAIVWVRAAVASSQGTAPCIAVVGSEDKLSREELWQISTELEPSGAIFHSWPEDCRSFDQAFESLGKEIAKTYGRPIIYQERSTDERPFGAAVVMSSV